MVEEMIIAISLEFMIKFTAWSWKPAHTLSILILHYIHLI